MELKKSALRHLGAVIAVCVLAAACSPDVAETLPLSAPSGVFTPPETQLERDMRLDFEAAEKSYRAFRAEYDRIGVRGGTSRATAVMRENAAGPYLQVMTKFSADDKRAGIRQTGNVQIGYVRHISHSPREVSLDTCEDGTKVTNRTSGGQFQSHGVALKLSLEFHLIDGKWKIWNGDDKRVSSCAL